MSIAVTEERVSRVVSTCSVIPEAVQALEREVRNLVVCDSMASVITAGEGGRLRTRWPSWRLERGVRGMRDVELVAAGSESELEGVRWIEDREIRDSWLSVRGNFLGRFDCLSPCAWLPLFGSLHGRGARCEALVVVLEALIARVGSLIGTEVLIERDFEFGLLELLIAVVFMLASS
jgi:hypothetical protein